MASLFEKLDMDMTEEATKRWDNLVPMLKNNSGVTYIYNVNKTDAAIYNGDAYGFFLNVCKIEPRYLYPTVLINDMKSPADFGPNWTEVKLIESATLRQMLLVIDKKT